MPDDIENFVFGGTLSINMDDRTAGGYPATILLDRETAIRLIALLTAFRDGKLPDQADQLIS